MEKWLSLDARKYYLAYYPDYDALENIGEVNLDENSEKYNIICNNEYGFILERTGNKTEKNN